MISIAKHSLNDISVIVLEVKLYNFIGEVLINEEMKNPRSQNLNEKLRTEDEWRLRE